MSKSILDHLIETTARLHAAVKPEWSTFEGRDITYRTYHHPRPMFTHTEAAAEARRIVTEFAGPPCEEFEPGEAIGVCEICRWPSREHGRAK